MAALNVEFSDAELEDLRAAAQEHGMTLKAFVRASTTDAIAHQRMLKEAGAEFQRVFADPELAAAIEAAGIDDGPMAHTAGRVA
ncbi:hypothetical protein [Streptomyces fagopyri]|uniref:hypothetical protein n=1 Tax=Streptomyces fagopyri TaxID=2662397 RepID=UPI001D177C60|nr:hypothetical protein [Streptomyces fagopyri]